MFIAIEFLNSRQMCIPDLARSYILELVLVIDRKLDILIGQSL